MKHEDIKLDLPSLLACIVILLLLLLCFAQSASESILGVQRLEGHPCGNGVVPAVLQVEPRFSSKIHL